MLANVPRTITSWLPRREPYELKSEAATPCSIRYLPAGLVALIEPAGEMWSVVMLSPRTANTRAPAIAATGGGWSGLPTEEGGVFSEGDRSSPAKRAPPGTSSEFQGSSPLKTSPYSFRNISDRTGSRIVSDPSRWVGQISLR